MTVNKLCCHTAVHLATSAGTFPVSWQCSAPTCPYCSVCAGRIVGVGPGGWVKPIELNWTTTKCEYCNITALYFSSIFASPKVNGRGLQQKPSTHSMESLVLVAHQHVPSPAAGTASSLASWHLAFPPLQVPHPLGGMHGSVEGIVLCIS